MNTLVESFNHAKGKTLKTVKHDSKKGTMTLEFENGELNNTLTFSVKNNAFGSFVAKPVVKDVKAAKLKQKEEALEPQKPIKAKAKKPKVTKIPD